MSSKTKSTSTKEGSKPALVPKLRFPEFRGDEGWASEPMGEIYLFKGNNSLSRDKLNYLAGSVKNIHYGDIHTKFATHFDITNELVPFINEAELDAIRDEDLCAEGDMIFADASEDLDDIGKSIEIVSLNGESVVSGLHTILARQTGNRIVKGFGGHLFKSVWVRSQIQREAQGAKVLGISSNRLRNIRLPLPYDKAEQRKIAACLSSVDEAIAAQARKVDALRTYKKGLMQQLFPRPERIENGVKVPAETQPRLRFPEFRKAERWVATILGKLSEVVRGGSPRPIDSFLTTAADGLNWLKIGDVDKEAKYVTRTTEKVRREALSKTRVVNPGDLILSNSMSFGRPYVLQIRTCIHDGWIAITEIDKRADQDFLYYLISAPSSQSYFVDNAAGSGVQNLNADIIKALPISIPLPAEQLRIASCLSTLDDLITAETRKLDTLKTHKKGLMQQLFPQVGGADA